MVGVERQEHSVETFLIKRVEPLTVKKRRPCRHPSRAQMMETWVEDEHAHKKKSATAVTLTAAAAAAAAGTSSPPAAGAPGAAASTAEHSNRASIGCVSVGATSSGDASVLNADDEVNGVDWSPEIPFENVSYCFLLFSRYSYFRF